MKALGQEQDMRRMWEVEKWNSTDTKIILWVLKVLLRFCNELLPASKQLLYLIFLITKSIPFLFQLCCFLKEQENKRVKSLMVFSYQLYSHICFSSVRVYRRTGFNYVV